ncbi:MAG TPA: hypothetical protein VFP61_04535 [Acidimicrobiales bacterium]|nr:hypothetical protein [Acidimicrobiales bacterium]
MERSERRRRVSTPEAPTGGPERRAGRPPGDARARSLLGNRNGRTLIAQGKLVVGSARDPLEAEADAVASRVVRRCSSHPTRHDEACGHDVGGSIRRLAGGPAAIGVEGGDVLAVDEAAVEAKRGGGRSLPNEFRAGADPHHPAGWGPPQRRTASGLTLAPGPAGRQGLRTVPA